MAIRSGLGAQLGFAAESTYGTYVAPTRFLEFTTEGLDISQEPIASQGIRKGSTVARTARWARNFKGGSGPVTFEVADKGFGLLFKHALGKSTITTPVGATNARLHTHVLDDMDNLYLTAQKGVPDTGGTTRAISMLGCVVTEFEISLDVDGLLMFTPTFDVRDLDTDEPLATASFAADDRLYGYQQAAITVDSTAADVTQMSFRVAHGMKTDRWYLKAAGTKGLPVLNAARDIGGQLTYEFQSMTEANRFVNQAPGTEVPVSALLTGRTIETGFNYQVGVKMPACRFDGELPKVAGPDVVMVTAPFTAFDNGSDAPVTVTYQTTDTAP